jgi:phosphate transport system permease protein
VSATSSSITNSPTPQGNSLTRRFSLTAFRESVIKWLLFACAFLSIFTTVGIIWALSSETLSFFREVSAVEFFTETRWTPQFEGDQKHFGILPLVTGTLLVAVIAAAIGLPLGLLSAIYLSEYASPKTQNVAKPILEILAGIPTVVFGYFALVFVTPYVLRPVLQTMLGLEVGIYNALSAGIVVGIMIVPTVCSLSEDALRVVPNGLREAAYALGSTKLDVSVRVVVPAALSGIIASFLLAFSRTIGETMAVTIAAGQQPVLNLNPLQSVETMTAFIVNISLGDTPAGSIEYKSLYAVAFALFVMTLTMNIISQWVMRRYREEYQ